MRRPALPVFVVLVLGACSEPIEEIDRFRFDEPIDQVVFEVESGAVDIEVVPGDEIRVEQIARYRCEPPEREAEVRDGALVLSAECRPGCFSCSVDYRVALPEAVEVYGWTGAGSVEVSGAVGVVEVQTGSGSISLCDVDAEVYAETGSGSLSMYEVSGSVDGYVGSGSIRGDDLTLEVLDVETGSGGIDLSWNTRPHRIDVETGSGGVDLFVPRGSYQIDLSTGAGSVEVSGIDDTNSCDDRIRVDTGAGGIRVAGY